MAVAIIITVCAVLTAFFLLWKLRRMKKEIDQFAEKLEISLDSIIAEKGSLPSLPCEDTDSLWGKVYEKLHRTEQIWQRKKEENTTQKKQIEELISDISHQTKTPIANLKLFVELLQDEPLSERGSKFLENIELQIEKLGFLLESMVKMSRLETGIIKIQKQKCLLRETLRCSIASIVPNAEQKEISLYVDFPDNLMLLHDPKWTGEAVFNLLDNAVKYTERGGSIHVSVVSQEIFTYISVQDSGKGVPPNRQAEIFTRFYREPEVHGQEGIGIGLYLTRKISELQGGYTEVRSEPGKGVDFRVKEREFVAVIGKSGSGKITLLHMVGGLDAPTSGEVSVGGRGLAKMSKEQLTIFRRRKVGFIFQSYNLVPDPNVYENVVLPIELDGRHIDRKFADNILSLLKLSEKKTALPNILSGGQQQRAAIARALASKPCLILADEPTGNLDTAASHDVMGLLKIAAEQFAQTIVLITHDHDIAQMADRIVQIEDGKIVEDQVSKGSDRYAEE